MKSIKIEGYIISYGADGEHRFTELPEDVCKEMCTCKDAGEGYARDSRYTYSIKGHNKHKGIPLGTAKVVIQTLLMKQRDFHIKEHKVTITKL